MRPDSSLFRAGERICAAVSGGADSVALLRWLAAEADARGWVVSVAHFQHRLRGEASIADEEFVCELAARFGLMFHREEADTAELSRGRSLEETARELRYAFFARLLEQDACDCVATAHTLDDQAETVLMKIIRGAGLDGLSGIAPVVQVALGRVVRPMLSMRRADVEEFLAGLGQDWREDASNRDEQFTRNRLRHTVMPLLREINPGVDTSLARLAEIARAEEAWWQSRIASLLAAVTLPGKPVRGGGRSVPTVAETALALDASRLIAMETAERRRVLRGAAESVLRSTHFKETMALEGLLHGRPGEKLELEGGLRAERSVRELRLSLNFRLIGNQPETVICAAGKTTEGTGFGLRVTMPPEVHGVLRVWKAGDRVRLRHTLSDSKVKDVLQRLRIAPEDRAAWPVIEVDGTIVWMRGTEMGRPLPGLFVTEE